MVSYVQKRSRSALAKIILVNGNFKCFFEGIFLPVIFPLAFYFYSEHKDSWWNTGGLQQEGKRVELLNKILS